MIEQRITINLKPTLYTCIRCTTMQLYHPTDKSDTDRDLQKLGHAITGRLVDKQVLGTVTPDGTRCPSLSIGSSSPRLRAIYTIPISPPSTTFFIYSY